MSYQHGGENGKCECIQGARRPAAGLKQSKHICQSRGRQENARIVSKSTTVRDMKTMVHGFLLHVPSASQFHLDQLQKTLNVPMICQRLFYKDHELEDNSTTVESLGILMDDTLHLHEEGKDSDPRKRWVEEKGFGGTPLVMLSSHAGLSYDTGTSLEGEVLHEAARTCQCNVWLSLSLMPSCTNW